MLQKIKITLIYFIFLLYWSLTIFFTFPENFLQIKALRYSKIFNTFFYQKWQFFAPPPQSNDRIYYEYVDVLGKNEVLEVLEPLSIQRQKEFLLNSNISVVDYLLSNNLTAITDNLRTDYNNFKINKCTDIQNEELCNAEFQKEISNRLEKIPEITTFINYGIIAGKKNLNWKKILKFKITATNIEIAKFNRRFLNLKNKENVLFTTKYYNLKTAKWEN